MNSRSFVVEAWSDSIFQGNHFLTPHIYSGTGQVFCSKGKAKYRKNYMGKERGEIIKSPHA